MYGLENLILNESENASWYNFGYWTAADDRYETACRKLACVVAEAAELDENQRVFDIGGGCGDQQILWLRRYRLQHVHAINTSASQVQFARNKIQQAGLPEHTISIESGDLAGVESPATYDRVISLDAAYHIEKPLLFRQSARLTTDGARLAFSDLVLDPGALKNISQFALRLICAASGIKYTELRSPEALRSAGEAHGWRNTKYDDVTTEVFAGYARFMRRSRGRLLRKHGLRSVRFAFAGLAITFILRFRLLRYVIVAFEKR